MDDRELRMKIQALDPISSDVVVRSVDDSSSHELLEGIMETNTESSSRGPVRFLIGAAAVVALVLGGFVLFNGTDTPAEPPLALSLGEPDALASCMVLTADILDDVPLAFAGTVTAIEGETVTLTVDEWYVGGDASSVELSAPAGLEALIGSIEFTEGEQYLISAYDGVVNYCGFSGPATPELQAVYDEAFPG
ncbi:MAG TPA: hypothetical protein VIW94_02775 [Acidimicrobiia bacterium]